MTVVRNSKCSRCENWYSHVFPDKEGNYVCLKCKYKKNEVGEVNDLSEM